MNNNEPLLMFGNGDYRRKIRPSDFNRRPEKLPPFKRIDIILAIVVVIAAGGCLKLVSMMGP